MSCLTHLNLGTSPTQKPVNSCSSGTRESTRSGEVPDAFADYERYEHIDFNRDGSDSDGFKPTS